MARDLQRRVDKRLRRAGAILSSEQIEQLCAYFGLLAKCNKRLNLTSLPTEPTTDDALDRLLVEPIVASSALVASDALLIDLGSGGGSPALPLKIAAPQLQLVMVEAKARKSAFLREAVRHLGLLRVEIANARFEELLTRVDLHESADIVSVRAVKADRRLWEAVQAFLAPAGRVFWFTTTQAAPLVTPPLHVDSIIALPGASRLVVLSCRI